jgi:hypothetical protein
MCGNYLLTKAFCAIQPLGHDLTRIIARAAGRLCREEMEGCLKVDKKPRQTDLRSMAQSESTFFGAAAHVAARLAGCSLFTQERLESFGRILGEASCDCGESFGGPVFTGPLRQRANQTLAELPQSRAKMELLALGWDSPGQRGRRVQVSYKNMRPITSPTSRAN